MKKKWIIAAVHILNGLGLTQSIDMFETPLQKLLAAGAHVFIAAVMPSLGGIGHQVVFGSPQGPPTKPTGKLPE